MILCEGAPYHRSVYQMSVDQMSADQMSADQMSVDQMSVDQMSVNIVFVTSNKQHSSLLGQFVSCEENEVLVEFQPRDCIHNTSFSP